MSYKITMSSDTHCNSLVKLFDGWSSQLLLLGGDFLCAGTAKEWYGKVIPELIAIRGQFGRIACTFGNHDVYCQNSENLVRQELSEIGIDLLIDQEITIDGLRIYGSPWIPFINNSGWAYMHPELWDEEAYIRTWSKVPKGLDILLTHTPAEGILAGPWGDPFLGERIMEVKPKYHVAGHIHSQHGSFHTIHTKRYNVAICDEANRPFWPVSEIEI